MVLAKLFIAHPPSAHDSGRITEEDDRCHGVDNGKAWLNRQGTAG